MPLNLVIQMIGKRFYFSYSFNFKLIHHICIVLNTKNIQDFLKLSKIRFKIKLEFDEIVLLEFYKMTSEIQNKII